MDDIHNALNAGYEITTPQRIPEKPVGTQGAGYIIIDPVTGAGSYRISGGLDGADANAPCAEPEPEPQPLATAFKVLLLTAIILLVLAGSGGLLGPAVATVMSSMGLSFLAFPATAGTPFCNPTESKRRGGEPLHNICSDEIPGNLFVGTDVCVHAPIFEKPKNFDAMVGNTLIEVKTWNYDNHKANPYYFIIEPELYKDKVQASPTARNCGFLYEYSFGDSRLPTIFEAIQPGFLPVVVDSFGSLPKSCIQPRK